MDKQKSDNGLLERLKKGDQQALAIIFQENSQKMFSIINRLVNHTDQSKDLLQDIFYKLWNGREYLPIQSIRPYLMRAAVNEALMYIRRHPIKKTYSLETVNLVESEDTTLEAEELEAIISRTVACMPPQRRAVFLLSRFEQMSYSEIATHLTISEKMVEKHISNALDSLRMALKTYLHLILITIVLLASS